MIRGTLDKLHLGDLLQWLKMGSMTGRLTLSGNGCERRFDFIRGRIVFVSSMVPSERLASFMAAARTLPLDTIRSCLATSLFQHRALTRVLLEDTSLRQEDLLKVIESLATLITARLLLSPAKEFVFDSDFPVRDLLGQDLALDPNRLLLEAARRTDESPEEDYFVVDSHLPITGEAFDNFFWELVGPSFTRQDPVSGEELLRLRHLIHDVVGTLSQWANTSFGLVPVPAAQVSSILSAVEHGETIDAEGFPQAIWDRTVIASGIRTSDPVATTAFHELHCDTSFHDLCKQLARATLWHRPDTPRLDQLSSATAARWARRAAAAASHLGVEPDQARLAAHLLVVPTDLVLWIMTTVSIPHAALRHTLLQRLPRRLGAILAMRAALPPHLQQLFQAQVPTLIGACLHLARATLPNANLWLDPLTGEDELLLEVASAQELATAARAIDDEIATDHASFQADGVG
ncbi:MAG: DUF4388 domain-containing protein [Acidobacteria bacterium]|nr:DUF4388 domain-containing protein [Acidobacteriota bacterium]